MNKMIRKQFFITAHAAAAGVSEAELVRAGIDLRLERKLEQQDWRNLVDKLSGSWAEREDLDEEMREIRQRWNRRDQIIGRKAKRS